MLSPGSLLLAAIWDRLLSHIYLQCDFGTASHMLCDISENKSAPCSSAGTFYSV